MHPLHRLTISLVFSLLVLLLPKENFSLLLRILSGWVIFAFCFTITGWIIMFLSPLERIKKVAKTEDGSKIFVFVMILIASFASLVAVLSLMIKNDGESRTSMFVFLVVFGMLISWAMVHTTFAFHYAHMFYDDDNIGKDPGSLDFPGEKNPDYVDFAYFAFVIGCTFQVSDVQVRSKKIRRMVLLHGLLSFALNTFVVALTINLIASLNK